MAANIPQGSSGRNDVTFQYGFEPGPGVQTQLQQQFAAFGKSLNVKSPFLGMEKEVNAYAMALDRANTRMVNLGASFMYINTIKDAMGFLVKSTIEVDKAMRDINAVFQLSSRNLDKFGKDLFNVANETSQAFNAAANAAKEFSRQGLSMQETLKRTRDAMVLTRLAGMDAEEAVNTLTASVNGFSRSGLETTQILNKLATVDASFAVSSRDLAQGLARAGAAASDAGVSFDELVGLITSAQQTTARGGAVIGNALKSIFTRVERQTTIEQFRALGVEVQDMQGNILPAIQLLQNFAKTYDTLGASVKKQAAELVGGVYQINILKALLSDVEKGNKSIFGQATGISAASTDEALRRNELLNQSLEATIQRAKNVGQQIASNFGSVAFSGFAKQQIGIFTNNPVVDALRDATGKAETLGGQIGEGLFKGVGNVAISTLGPILTVAFGRILRQLTQSTYRSLTQDADLFGTRRADVEKRVLDFYRSGDVALKQQLSTMTSATERAALLARHFAQIDANVKSANASMKEMTAGVIATGYSPRYIPRKATGYIPHAAGGGVGEAISAESRAISMGVGGASGARPVFMPSFNFGKGNVGPLVANSSEFIVPHYAGGGSAIFNREMIYKHGLPKGAVPVAAGGYTALDPSKYKFEQIMGGKRIDFDTLNRILKAASETQNPEDFDRLMTMGMRLSSGSKGLQNEVIKQLGGMYSITKNVAIESRSGKLGKLVYTPEVFKSIEQPYANIRPGNMPVSERVNPLTDPSIVFPSVKTPNVLSKEKAFEMLDQQNKEASEKIKKLNEAGQKEIEAFEKNRISTVKNVDLLIQSAALKDAKVRERAVKRAAMMSGEVTIDTSAFDNLTQSKTLRERISQPFTGTSRLATEVFAATKSTSISQWDRKLREAENISKVYRQQVVEEARERRPQEIAAQNKRLESLRERLNRNRIEVEERRLREVEPQKLLGQSKSSRWSSFNEKYYNKAMAAGFILPMMAGFLPEGTGGTRSGQALGALSGAASGAGFGMAVGSFIPGIGTAGGLGIGALAGAAYGLINKMTKSIEEIAKEVDDEINVAKSRTQSIISYQNIQKQIEEAQRSGESPYKIRALRAQLGEARIGMGEYFHVAQMQGMDKAVAMASENALKTAQKGAAQLSLNRYLSGDMKGDRGLEQFAQSIAPTVGVGSKDLLRMMGQVSSQAALSARYGVAGDTDMLRNIIEQVFPKEYAGKIMGKITSEGSSYDAASNLGRILNEIYREVRKGEETPAEKSKREQADRYSQYQRGTVFNIEESLRGVDLQRFRSQLSLRSGLRDLAISGAVRGESGVSMANEKAGMEYAFAQSSAATSRRQIMLTLRDRFMKAAGGVNAPEDLSKEITGMKDIGQFGAFLLKYGTPGSSRGKDIEGLHDFYTEQVKALEQIDADLDESKAASEEAKRQLRDYNSVSAALLESERQTHEINVKSAKENFEYRQKLAEIDFASSQGRLTARQEVSMRAGISVAQAESNLRAVSGVRLQSIRGSFKQLLPQGTFDDKNEAQLREILTIAQKGGMDPKATAQLEKELRDYAEERLKLEQQIVETRTEGENQIKAQSLTWKEVMGKTAREMGKEWQRMDEVIIGSMNSLQSNATDAWMSFVTGAKNGGNAMRSFVTGVLSDMSRMLASKAFSTVIFSLFGNMGMPTGTAGKMSASGGPMGFAGGGKVPALLTGGEFYVSPQAAKRIGYDTLHSINRYADGGMVRGGSGMKDDVPAMLKPGSFIVRKSAVNKLGPDYLQSLVDGRIQKRFWGGFILPGMLLGAGVGYLTGGTKGALVGAGMGALAGGFGNMAAGNGFLGSSLQGAQGSTLTIGTGGLTSSGEAAKLVGGMSLWEKTAWGLGLSAALGAAAYATSDKLRYGKNLSGSEIWALQGQLESQQSSEIGSYAGKGQVPYMQINPQGGYSLLGYGYTPSTRRFADGGVVDGGASYPSVTGGAPSSDSGRANINITINHNAATGQSDMKSSATGNGVSPEMAEQLGVFVEAKWNELTNNGFRNGGIFRENKRFLSS